MTHEVGNGFFCDVRTRALFSSLNVDHHLSFIKVSDEKQACIMFKVFQRVVELS